MKYFSPYVQDVWKISPRLTLSTGLRWEPYFPLTTQYDHVSHFYPDAFLQNRRSKVYVNAPAGTLFPGDDGYPGHSMNNRRLANFAPRLGLVLDPRGNGMQVIRAAYGISYDIPPMFYYVLGAGAPPWASVTQLNDVQLSDPWKNFPGGNPFPRALTKDTTFPVGGSYYNTPLDVKPIYTQQWNVGFQKQIGTDWSLTLSYLGNKTTHLWLGTQRNPAVYIPGNSTTANINQRRRLYLLSPTQGQFYGSLTEVDFGGNANYNAGLVAIQKRLSHNFSVLGNYTLAHCINDGDPQQLLTASYQNPDRRAADRSNCFGDRRHIVNVTAVMDTPAVGSPAFQRITKGWQLATIFKVLSGEPINLVSGRDNALSGQGNQRPDVLRNPVLVSQTFNQWFDTAALGTPAAGQYGSLGRNALTGPGWWNIDAAVVRMFSIREKNKLELRAEGFNMINHLRPKDPTTNMTSTLFGRITSAEDPRILQFALKYVF
jgi:hypothetical protein